MSVSRYFQNFPIINYSNTQAVDITVRIAPLNKVLSNPYVFYPYDIAEFERPDQFSYRYYDDSFKSWIIYLSNKTTDPYYSWYINQNELEELINLKYGINSANNEVPVNLIEQKIKYYQNNWNESQNISVSAFDALPIQLQKYWEPVFGNFNNILSYQRKQLDWTVKTNRIVSYTLASNSQFIKDEICNIVFDTNNTGNGQVLAVNNNVLYIQHTIGTTTANVLANVNILSNSYIFGTESNINVNFTNATIISETFGNNNPNNLTLPAEEEVYWKPISYFEYETTRNESNKTIQVLDNRYAKQFVDNFNDILKTVKE